MGNDNVRDFKLSCKELDDKIRAYYDDVEYRGADDKDLDDIVRLLKNLKVLQNVDKSTLEDGKDIYNDIYRSFNLIKDKVDAYLKEREIIEVQDVKKADNKVLKAVSGALLIALGYVLGSGKLSANASIDKSMKEPIVEASIEQGAEQEKIAEDLTDLRVAEINADEYVVDDTTYVDPNLVPGSYGTFLDVENNEQVLARAQYIYDTYFANRLDELTDDERNSLTVDKIANTIRVMNGKFPLTEDGEVYMDGYVVDNYTVTLVDALVNSISNKNQAYVHVPGHLFAVDYSELSEFIKAYDVLYEKLIYGLNTKNDEIIEEAIACLGYRYNHEWYLQGMYNQVLKLGSEGDEYRTIVNPHNLDVRVRYLAFIATVEPFNTTALEWHLSKTRPVCIEMCNKYGTENTTLVPVNDIHSALETGAWSDIGAKLAGQEDDAEPVPWLVQFYQALYQGLQTDYQIYLVEKSTGFIPEDTKEKTLTRNI